MGGRLASGSVPTSATSLLGGCGWITLPLCASGSSSPKRGDGASPARAILRVTEVMRVKLLSVMAALGNACGHGLDYGGGGDGCHFFFFFFCIIPRIDLSQA